MLYKYMRHYITYIEKTFNFLTCIVYHSLDKSISIG